MGVTLRGFLPDDLDAVLELRDLVFPGLTREREVRRWRWEFDDNPARSEDLPFTWVLDDGGRLAGNFGMIPYRMKVGRKMGRAIDGIDLAIHPDYQGRGLANLLADALMDPSRSDFPFVSAPTPATTHLMVARGGTIVGGDRESLTWICPLGEAVAPAEQQRIEEAAARVEWLDRFDERADGLWEKLAGCFDLIVVRDAAFLNWRYRDYPFGRPHLLAAPGENGELAGLAVVQEDPSLGRAYLLELLAEPGDAATLRCLLRAARHRVSGSGPEILAVITRLAALHEPLRECGFSELGGAVPIYVGKVNDPASGADISRWYVSLGEGDALLSVGDGAA